ncbi:hypothetical protein P7C70_g3860, partial [Phenoliferia sp. Uapishka_3]
MKRTLSRLSAALKPISKAPIAVDSHCIPLEPPYSLTALIPPPTPLPRATLLKLHKLSALLPPKTEAEWNKLDDLGGLVAIMEGVRGFGKATVDEAELRKVAGWKAAEPVMIDARVRAEDSSTGASVDLERSAGTGSTGKEETGLIEGGLVGLAQKREGMFYVVRTPEGIRGKGVHVGKAE